MKLHFKIFILILLLININLFASTEQRRGTAGAQELLIPVGSRGTALNGAYTSGIDGVEAIYWNPAGLAISGHTVQVMFSHQNYLADMAVNYGAVATNVENFGSIGLSIKAFDFGAEIVETTVENPDGTGRTFTPVFLTFGLTYARHLTDNLTFGTNFKIISEQIINVQAIGFAFDLGVQYFTGIEGLNLGFVFKNFGPRMAFSGPELDHKVDIPGTETGTDKELLGIKSAEFDLPAQFEIGTSYIYNLNENNSLAVMGVFQNNSFSFDTYNIASEYIFNNWVFLRASYTLALREGLEGKNDGLTSSSEDYLFGPSFGAGVKLNMGDVVVMNIDYAYRTAAIFDGDVQWFTITFGL